MGITELILAVGLVHALSAPPPPIDEVRRDELSKRCFVWRPEACREGHKKADREMIKKLTKGFTREQSEKLVTQAAWDILQKNKDPETALLRFNQSLILNPKSAEAWWGAGTAAAELMLTADAEKCLKRSVELNPKNALAYYNLGKLYFGQKRNALSAKNMLMKSLEVDPRYRDAYKLLALCEYNLNDFKAAKEHYDQAVLLGSAKEPEFEAKLSKALTVNQ